MIRSHNTTRQSHLDRTLPPAGGRHKHALAAHARAAVLDAARLGRAPRRRRLQVQLDDAGERASRAARLHYRCVHIAAAVAWTRQNVSMVELQTHA